MSAYIVNDKTLNRILTFVNDWNFYNNTELKKRFWDLIKYDKDETPEQVLSKVGLILKELNSKAVEQRYNEKHDKQEFVYSFEKCDIFQAYQHLGCLIYQMSEGNVPETDLYKLLQEIETRMGLQIANEHPKVKNAEWNAK